MSHGQGGRGGHAGASSGARPLPFEHLDPRALGQLHALFRERSSVCKMCGLERHICDKSPVSTQNGCSLSVFYHCYAFIDCSFCAKCCAQNFPGLISSKKTDVVASVSLRFSDQAHEAGREHVSSVMHLVNDIAARWTAELRKFLHWKK